MDKKLVAMLNEFGILEDEIDALIKMCPGLEIVDYEKACKCVIALIKAGYPQVDISSLIYVNPSFMMYEPKDLEEKLKQIGGDIESKLKEDPFLI